MNCRSVTRMPSRTNRIPVKDSGQGCELWIGGQKGKDDVSIYGVRF